MVLGKLPAPGRPTTMIVGQRPIALAEGTGGGCLDILLSFFSLSIRDGPIWTEILSQRAVNPNQPTNSL